MVKIALLTDLHISSFEAAPMGVFTKESFRAVLQKAVDSNPDLIVLNGDLCHKTGEKPVYDLIKSDMDEWRIPYTGIPGNHDDTALMHETFGWDINEETSEMYYTFNFAARTFIFLDTSKAKVSGTQLEWLKENIHDIESKQIVIFMHHPPLKCDSRHMEPVYAFEDMDIFKALFNDFPDRMFHVFCGHYHMERTVFLNNVVVYLSPSTFIQIDPDFGHFVKGNDLIGFRQIIWQSDDRIVSDCLYN
jgi:3',5'-cyclic-AMP phosphodiesterase